MGERVAAIIEEHDHFHPRRASSSIFAPDLMIQSAFDFLNGCTWNRRFISAELIPSFGSENFFWFHNSHSASWSLPVTRYFIIKHSLRFYLRNNTSAL
jgi:hypothetical protein